MLFSTNPCDLCVFRSFCAPLVLALQFRPAPKRTTKRDDLTRVTCALLHAFRHRLASVLLPLFLSPVRIPTFIALHKSRLLITEIRAASLRKENRELWCGQGAQCSCTRCLNAGTRSTGFIYDHQNGFSSSILDCSYEAQVETGANCSRTWIILSSVRFGSSSTLCAVRAL